MAVLTKIVRYESNYNRNSDFNNRKTDFESIEESFRNVVLF